MALAGLGRMRDHGAHRSGEGVAPRRRTGGAREQSRRESDCTAPRGRAAAQHFRSSRQIVTYLVGEGRHPGGCARPVADIAGTPPLPGPSRLTATLPESGSTRDAGLQRDVDPAPPWRKNIVQKLTRLGVAVATGLGPFVVASRAGPGPATRRAPLPARIVLDGMAMAVRNSPRVRGSSPNRSALIRGNRLMGIDGTVVARSVSRAPRMTGVRARKARPSSTPRRPGRAGSFPGSSCGRPNAPWSAAMKVRASIR